GGVGGREGWGGGGGRAGGGREQPEEDEGRQRHRRDVPVPVDQAVDQPAGRGREQRDRELALDAFAQPAYPRGGRDEQRREAAQRQQEADDPGLGEPLQLDVAGLSDGQWLLAVAQAAGRQ